MGAGGKRAGRHRGVDGLARAAWRVGWGRKLFPTPDAHRHPANRICLPSYDPETVIKKVLHADFVARHHTPNAHHHAFRYLRPRQPPLARIGHGPLAS